MNGMFRCLIMIVTLLGLPVAVVAQERRQPNVVVILADDLGYGDLGCYGSSKNPTPNLDRLAAEGIKLTQFNCPMAFCAPTRASLLTGRYPFRCGMNQNPAPDGAAPEVTNLLHLAESEVLLPQLLKQAGYATGMIGKWHLGHAKTEWLPTQRGFDEYFGIPYSNDMRPVQVLEGNTRVEYPVVQATLTQRYTERAVDFIERNKARPFFLYFAQAMPHKPLAASEAFYKKSGAGLYGDAVAELDWSVGQVLAKLKAVGVDEQTFVVFTSDNGATFGGSTGGLRGMKGSSYEGGYRVPCIARWPGKIGAGRQSAETAVMMDLFATVLKVAGVAGPADRVIDGQDLLPVMKEGGKSPHPFVLGQQAARVATIRDGRWKLHVLKPVPGLIGSYKPGDPWTDPRAPDGVTILAPYEQSRPTEHPGLASGDEPAAMQLFDLAADPGEQHDVAATNPAEMKRLMAMYEEINRSVPVVAAPAGKKGKK
jgi:uncharacterized sulfatase